ncbi:hypothetical protein [Chitiniphilus shinanonensis]|uniref:hypothetical protein n=1 Tax=Chitiniphilus shinanonensis TaxID=553088 RepID=UPI00303CB298
MLKTYDMSSGSAEALEEPASAARAARTAMPQQQAARPELQLRLLTVAEAEAARQKESSPTCFFS